jgi:2-polyprenyl-3-methyl-5-hydroxy-6-metoxy-1,4-benzoquinol methylase
MDPRFDSDRAERFAERLLASLDGAALGLLTSVGHRTGLFDVLRGLAPATPEQIAGQAGLCERYVREWLAAMASAGVLEHDAAAGSFALPPEHAAVLTRAARPLNLAAAFQWIPVLGAVEDEVVNCFERGGGVPASAYGRFHAVRAEESDQSVVAGLVERIVPLVPGLPAALADGRDVLDVGCGSGRALCRMAEVFPRSRFTGIDCAPEAIAAARAFAREQGLANASFLAADAADFEAADAFDLITAFAAIHRQARPALVLRRVAGALRPEGTFLMQEYAGAADAGAAARRPLDTFLHALSCLQSLPASLAAGGPGLGAVSGERALLRMLAEAGFGSVGAHALPHDRLHRYYVARKA